MFYLGWLRNLADDENYILSLQGVDERNSLSGDKVTSIDYNPRKQARGLWACAEIWTTLLVLPKCGWLFAELVPLFGWF